MNVGVPRGLAPLRYRNFALYWTGFITSNAGKWMEITGAVWLAYLLTDSPLLLGLLGVFRAVPAVVLSPIAGVIADRFDKRTILFVVQGLSFAVSGTIGLLIATGHVEVWHLYLQVAAQSGLAAVDAATRQAMFPTLVPRAHLVEAVTLQSTAARSAGLIGPAIGGFVIAGLGEAAPFLVNGATSLVLILALAAMRDVPSEVRERRPFRAELAEGFHYLWRSPTLRGLLQMEFIFSLFRMNPVIITIVAGERLGVGPEGLGGLLAAEGVGAVVGVVALVALGSPGRPGRYVILGTVAYAASLVVFAAAGVYLLAFAALVVAGFWDSSIMVTRNSVMQLEAPGQMRGRVMANLGMVSRGTTPLSQTQSGLLVEVVGASLALVAAAVVLGLNAAATAAMNPVLRAFSTATSVEGGSESGPEADPAISVESGPEADPGRSGTP